MSYDDDDNDDDYDDTDDDDDDGYDHDDENDANDDANDVVTLRFDTYRRLTLAVFRGRHFFLSALAFSGSCEKRAVASALSHVVTDLP